MSKQEIKKMVQDQLNAMTEAEREAFDAQAFTLHGVPDDVPRIAESLARIAEALEQIAGVR